MEHVIAHFNKVDPILSSLLSRIEIPPVIANSDHFAQLCDIIISQQLSGKAAATIFGRFTALFPAGKITAKNLVTIPDEKVRAVGASNSKVKFLKSLARAVTQGEIVLERLPDLTNEQIIAELVKLHGIGPWSADMFLMFSLGREDVFSYGDLGLRTAIRKLYKFKKEPTVAQMEKITKKWSPYRTYAARILWKSLEL